MADIARLLKKSIQILREEGFRSLIIRADIYLFRRGVDVLVRYKQKPKQVRELSGYAATVLRRRGLSHIAKKIAGYALFLLPALLYLAVFKGIRVSLRGMREKHLSKHAPDPRKFKVLFVYGLEPVWHSKRYRVDNLRARLSLCGNESDAVVDDEFRCRVLLRGFGWIDQYDLLILHRVGMDACFSELIDIAREAGIVTIFSSDDLIFDPHVLRYIDAYKMFSSEEKLNYRRGVARYRELLRGCDYFIGSTNTLAAEARKLGKESFVIRNGLNETQLEESQMALQQRQPHPGEVRIGYFSGTATHQKDFAEASPAVLRLLRRYPKLKLYVVGHLDLDRRFERFQGQIVRLPFVDWKKLPYEIAKVDIQIVPLESNNPFTDSKSELKYFEAALLKVPTVASATPAFRFAIRHGENGFLAKTEGDWYRYLRRLVEDGRLRRKMGEKAYRHTLANYTPKAQARVVKAVFGAIIDDFREGGYQSWLRKHKLTKKMLREMAEEAVTFKYRPKISIITPVYNTEEEWLVKMIESVRSQIYGVWELCLADDASTKPHVRKIIESYRKKDKRIKVVYRERAGHICRASNSSLKLATGEFIALLDHDDELAPEALYEVVKLLNAHPDADMVYSDEDKLEYADGDCRVEPYFKPDWSPDMFMSRMYTCHLGVYRKSLVDQLGGFRPGYEGAQDYDLVLRLTEKTDRIYHIPKILYHWRKVPGSAAASTKGKPYAVEAGRRALSDAVKRRGIKATVLIEPKSSSYRVKRKIIGQPKVTIVIPTKDKVDLLKQCVKSIEEKIRYKNYEIVVVDNNSVGEETKRYLKNLPHTVLRFKEPFNFSRINNFAVARTKGEHLLFLNNDTRVINEGWLEAMLEHSQREEVGAVGAKLLYPDNTIQHAGVILGLGGIAGHSHKYLPAESVGYFGSLAFVRNYSAVTAACMMVRRDVFEEVGMFEEKLPRAYNDVDLCLKLRKKGYLIVYTPFAKLYHCESATRPKAVDKFEQEYMRKKWGRLLKEDPYYNQNLSLKRESHNLRI